MDETPKDQPDPSPEAARTDPKQEAAESHRKPPLLVDITEQVLGRAVVITGGQVAEAALTRPRA